MYVLCQCNIGWWCGICTSIHPCYMMNYLLFAQWSGLLIYFHNYLLFYIIKYSLVNKNWTQWCLINEITMFFKKNIIFRCFNYTIHIYIQNRTNYIMIWICSYFSQLFPILYNKVFISQYIYECKYCKYLASYFE